ncbi:hypothetical protein [Hwanghaeella grinnelliae]|uniref:hypothetical protein n=1 Tax=Hwanghaeella grinnelliae TaxID=2500179 RepID=UPI00129AD62D|nr:hypothetical protein [Hwanghaeella grinnelliae]
MKKRAFLKAGLGALFLLSAALPAPALAADGDEPEFVNADAIHRSPEGTWRFRGERC